MQNLLKVTAPQKLSFKNTTSTEAADCYLDRSVSKDCSCQPQSVQRTLAYKYRQEVGEGRFSGFFGFSGGGWQDGMGTFAYHKAAALFRVHRIAATAQPFTVAAGLR